MLPSFLLSDEHRGSGGRKLFMMQQEQVVAAAPITYLADLDHA